MEVSVPTTYKDFLAMHGPFEGFLLDEAPPGYIELWQLDDIASNNQDIEISKHAPSYLAFAGNGGGEVLAFDSSGAVYMLPLIGMAADTAIKVADCFTELASRFDPAA
ncbi:SMI1/KNR4 family protein [Xanthomonas sp. D-109]|uniref:SMI1/KNR4 family protein n=1 Tax=Xanthomonas TaxID=338 RepID=UPI001AD9E0C5|nr:SMI1/KNR4 family protein [Xanthomonas sp. D-109]MBO9880707.1 SMI1/KNR4 family protein [Xanthomonas sp. D-109]